MPLRTFSQNANTQPTAAMVKMNDRTEKAMEARLQIRLRLTNAATSRIIAAPFVAVATAGSTNPKVISRMPPGLNVGGKSLLSGRMTKAGS